jgi:hypothetical protein
MTDDTNDTTSQDDQFSTDNSASVGGRGGIGKTTHPLELLRHVVRETDGETEWFDPKGSERGDTEW